jgi:hypothetical protein
MLALGAPDRTSTPMAWSSGESEETSSPLGPSGDRDRIIASARRGRISDNANTVTNIVLGSGVIAGAALLYGFAGQLTNLVFGG